ncbi:hypothetical protein FACS189451_08880 [Bacteroidia bacterium]|nr:hypothetical protein FACS189451_08880 [Bacteroidia bacterium]
MNTFENLIARAMIIMNEKRKKLNDENRVGSLFRDIILYSQNIVLGIFLKGSRNNISEILALVSPQNGDTYKANDSGHYWRFDGNQWNDIGMIIPTDYEINNWVREW